MYNDQVAPSLGAWIETLMRCYLVIRLIVAPSLGAWIEMRYRYCSHLQSYVDLFVGGVKWYLMNCGRLVEVFACVKNTVKKII